AFLDPFDLANLDFEIIATLAKVKRMDMLIHVSQMDLQRNAVSYAMAEHSAFDKFAPGWREHVPIRQPQQAIRQQVFSYWRDKVAELGVWPSTEMRLITGSRKQPLYWLLMAAKHPLPHKFWQVAANIEKQGSLAF